MADSKERRDFAHLSCSLESVFKSVIHAAATGRWSHAAVVRHILGKLCPSSPRRDKMAGYIRGRMT